MLGPAIDVNELLIGYTLGVGRYVEQVVIRAECGCLIWILHIKDELEEQADRQTPLRAGSHSM